MNNKTRIDWFRALTDLDRAGQSNAAVARALNVPRCRVWSWKDGAEPRYEDGRRVIAMWSAATGRPPIDAPEIQDERSRAKFRQR